MKGKPESLNYKIVQDSNITDDNQIDKYTGTVIWEYLENHFSITFTHCFNNFKTNSDTAYFAWTYPYSFQ